MQFYPKYYMFWGYYGFDRKDFVKYRRADDLADTCDEIGALRTALRVC